MLAGLRKLKKLKSQTNMEKIDEKKEILTYTLILHQAREKLGITLNEYAVADAVYHLSNNPSNDMNGWCFAAKETLGGFIGISRKSTHGIINRLIIKKLIEKHPKTNHLRTTKLWYEIVVLPRVLRKVTHRVTKQPTESNERLQGCNETTHNSNSNKDNDTNKDTNSSIIKWLPKDLELAELLFNLIKEENPDWHVKPDFDSWANDIRKIREIDRRTHKQIEYVIKWVQNDDFWKQNILSPVKLRKQFNSLVVKIKAQVSPKRRRIGIAIPQKYVQNNS